MPAIAKVRSVPGTGVGCHKYLHSILPSRLKAVMGDRRAGRIPWAYFYTMNCCSVVDSS
jgi:hypothetical protein